MVELALAVRIMKDTPAGQILSRWIEVDPLVLGQLDIKV
jgi:hypothetical protein